MNSARGLSKSHGERLRKCDTQQVSEELAGDLPHALRAALAPLLAEAESLYRR